MSGAAVEDCNKPEEEGDKNPMRKDEKIDAGELQQQQLDGAAEKTHLSVDAEQDYKTKKKRKNERKGRGGRFN